MNRIFIHLKNARKSRYFLPGLLIGFFLGGLLTAAILPQFRATLDASPHIKPGGASVAKSKISILSPSAGIQIHSGATIVVEGDSLVYGFSRKIGETFPPINGSTQGRIRDPFPETLEKMIGHSIAVINRGFPGDRSIDGLTRWSDLPSGDLAVIMYGTNDSNIRNNGNAISTELYAVTLESLVRRRLYAGAQVILLLPPPGSWNSSATKLDPYREAALEVGRRTGVVTLDAAAALKASSAPYKLMAYT